MEVTTESEKLYYNKLGPYTGYTENMCAILLVLFLLI